MDYALVNEKEASVIVRRLETYRSYLETYFTGWQLIENYITITLKVRKLQRNIGLYIMKL
jgi:hypothetical protein